MKTERYLVRVYYHGKAWQLPVSICYESIDYRITVDIEGIEVCFARDEHDGLVPLNHQDDFEPQFLYLVGREVQEQRPFHNLNKA